VFETNLLFPSSDEKMEAAGISDNVHTYLPNYTESYLTKQ